MRKLGRCARRHFLTLIEIGVHLIPSFAEHARLTGVIALTRNDV